MRRLLAVACLVSATALARPKPLIFEVTSAPTTPRALLAAVGKEKPGPARQKLVQALDLRLREKGQPFEDPDGVDAITGAMFERIFDDMAAATDVWVWEASAAPRGDVLLRETVKLLPGFNSSGFSRAITVSPKGKRIDRGYLNTPCTVTVSVAKSEADWFEEAEGRKRWTAMLHPVLQADGVVRAVVSLYSPSRAAPFAPRHERPVWVAYFAVPAAGAPWTPALFEPAAAKEQRLQEATILPADPKATLTDSQRQLVLALRLADVRAINPARKVLSKEELQWTSLTGLTGESPVDAKQVAWLEPYWKDHSALVRAVALVRAFELGARVPPSEFVRVLETVRATALQAEAMGALGRALEASVEPVPEADRALLMKAPDEVVKVAGMVAMVKKGERFSLYQRAGAGWKLVQPLQ